MPMGIGSFQRAMQQFDYPKQNLNDLGALSTGSAIY